VAFGALCISFSPVLVVAIDPAALGPTAIGLHRVTLGALVLVVTARVRKERFGGGRVALVAGVAAALAFAGDLFTWHRSILGVGAGMSTILANTQVVWVSLWGVFVLREVAGGRVWTAVLLATAGVVLMSGVLAPRGMPRADPGGFALGIGTGLFYAAYILLLRRARTAPRCPGPAALMAWVSAWCAVFLLLTALLEGAYVGVPDTRSFLCVLGLAVVVQGLGWVVVSSALPHVPAAVGALLLLLQPTLATLWGALLFRERLQPLELGGAALVLLGIYLGTSRSAAPVAARRPR
jgi:drug/metabolite transporter (DMT)-like permease